MGADVERVVVDQLQQVLVQQDHLAAFLARFCLHIAVSQRAFEVEYLQGRHSINRGQKVLMIQTATTEETVMDLRFVLDL